MILASFQNKKKEYVYTLKNNKIEYGYKTKEGISNNLTINEINLMNQLYTKFTISKEEKNHKKCGIVQYHNKTFQIMYDIISQRKFFYEINGNTYQTPTLEDFLYLDNKLNPEYLFLKNTSIFIKNETINRLTKTILIQGMSITITLSGLHYINQSHIIDNVYLTSHQTIETIQENMSNLTIEDLKLAVEKNDNLSIEEKEFILSNFDILEENIEYIDIPMIYNRLLNLSISYDSSNFPVNEASFSVLAKYTTNNVIIVYGCSSFEEVKEKRENDLRHELFHVFTARHYSLTHMTYEAMNEIFSLEYGNENLKNNSYSLNSNVVYPLIELIGPEKMKEYYFKNNPQILIHSLTDIIDDENKAYELIGMIDNLEINYADQINENPDLSLEEVKENLYSPINALINEYFTEKYGYDMMQDEIMENYIYNQGSSSKMTTSMNKALEALFQTGVYPEKISWSWDFDIPYFSKNEIQENSNQMIYLWYIDNDNQFKVFSYSVESPEREKMKTK
jgi:hypothetical protein